MSTDITKVHHSYRRHKGEGMRRYRGWLPASPHVHKRFLHQIRKESKRRMDSGAHHVPSVRAFSAAIMADHDMVKLLHQMFLQVARVPDVPGIENFEQLLYHLDCVVTKAPSFCIAKDDHGNKIGEPVGVPILLLLDLLTNTYAGAKLFSLPAFNEAMKALLDSWGEFLTTPESANVLNDTDEGWFSPTALALLDEGRGEFNKTYVTPDPSAINRGYTSWDHFFTREIQPSARPVFDKDDPTVLHNPCESTVYNIANNVQLHDQFWLKDQRYSLYDMLDKDVETAKGFVGGTVYQAFLGPTDHHRWHAPCNGTIVEVRAVPGTYYAVLPDEGAPSGDPDLKEGDPHCALLRSQGFLTVCSTRLLIYINADNADLGLLCFIGIGMAEVSTCAPSVKAGDRVTVGDELGTFRFGGSTYAMVFGPQAKITFGSSVVQDKHLLVNTFLGHIPKEWE